MSQDIFTFSSSALPEETGVVAFEGREALCRPYRFDILLTVPDGAAVDRRDALGAKASLFMHPTADGAALPIHGVIAGLSLLHTWGARALFRLTLVPQLWICGHDRRSRVFTKMKLPEIITEVLEEEGLTSDDFELRLTGDHQTEEHVCQYQESSLEFLHRWMEREGLYYFFEQGERSEKLIVVDDRSAHVALPPAPLPYRTRTASGRAGEA